MCAPGAAAHIGRAHRGAVEKREDVHCARFGVGGVLLELERDVLLAHEHRDPDRERRVELFRARDDLEGERAAHSRGPRSAARASARSVGYVLSTSIHWPVAVSYT